MEQRRRRERAHSPLLVVTRLSREVPRLCCCLLGDFPRITVFCSKQMMQKAAVSCFALGHGVKTLRRCSSAASLSQIHPGVPRPGQAGGMGSPRLLVALLTPH